MKTSRGKRAKEKAAECCPLQVCFKSLHEYPSAEADPARMTAFWDVQLIERAGQVILVVRPPNLETD